MPDLAALRQRYHHRLATVIIRFSENRKGDTFPNFSDGSSRTSVLLGRSIYDQMASKRTDGHLQGQTMGKAFEELTCDFIRRSS